MVQPRTTVAGHIPTSWAKPHRAAVVMFGVAAVLTGWFVIISAPESSLEGVLVYGEARARAAFIGLEGPERNAYRLAAAVDFAFIAIYSVFVVNWVRFFRNRHVGFVWQRPAMGALPGMFDLLETSGVYWTLRVGAERVPDVAYWMMVVGTPLKWLAVVFVAVIAVRGEVGWWRKRRRRAARRS